MENYTRAFALSTFFIAVTTGTALLMNSPVEKTYTATFPGSDAPQLDLEAAETREERQKGLMYRRSIEPNTGMLFIFEEDGYRSFWMKNTYIPLDMIFVNSNGTIVNIEQANPQPDAKEGDLESYRSEKPVKYVIETRQGFAEKHGIEEGEKVVITERG